LTDFLGDEDLKKKKKSKWPTQNTEFFKIANSQNFVVKISWIGPWVGRIN
jgi:hypothetical protein